MRGNGTATTSQRSKRGIALRIGLGCPFVEAGKGVLGRGTLGAGAGPAPHLQQLRAGGRPDGVRRGRDRLRRAAGVLDQRLPDGDRRARHAETARQA